MKRKYYIKVRELMTRLEVHGDKTLFKYASRGYGDPSNAFSHATSNSGNEQNPR